MKKIAKGNNPSLHIDEELNAQIQQAIDGELGKLNLRELLSMLLSTVANAERTQYLQNQQADKGNGSYERQLGIGSIPISMQVPRTRSSLFRPQILPKPYQRGYPEEMQSFLLGLLSSCRSLNAAKASLKKLGLSVSEQEMDTIAKEFIEELELRNTKTCDPDLISLFIDGKHVEVRDGDRLRPGCIYVAVGLLLNGTKRILACSFHFGQENLENWKKVLRSLIERGLRRVLIVVQDDFSGLMPITKSLFSKADVQLCIVHMQRNAKKHFNKTNGALFQQHIKAIKACFDEEIAASQFEQMCDHFKDASPAFIKSLRKKRAHYLAFLKFPPEIQLSFSTTNAVEAVNGQLERLRRNNGGYFHSEDVLKLKLGMTITYLEEGIWRRPSGSISVELPQLIALFEARFESE